MTPWYAMWAQRYMHEFGVTSEDLAEVAVRHRYHATLNPASVMGRRGPLTVEDVVSSRIVSSPLHLFDCAIDTDGGYAIVVASAEVARGTRGKPVWVIGGAEATHTDGYTTFDPPWFPGPGHSVRRSGDIAFAQAGVSRDDIDVAGLYDCFTAAAAAMAGATWSPGRPRRVTRAAIAALIAGLIGVAAFVAGQHHHSSAVTMLTGLAYTGGQQASVIVDGYTYGFEGVGSVTWLDSQGETHEGGWPACLAKPGTTHRIMFGYVPVTAPDGTGVAAGRLGRLPRLIFYPERAGFPAQLRATQRHMVMSSPGISW